MVSPKSYHEKKLTDQEKAHRAQQQRERRANQNAIIEQILRQNNSLARKRQRSQLPDEITEEIRQRNTIARQQARANEEPSLAQEIQERNTIAHRNATRQARQASAHRAMCHTAEILTGHHVVAPFNLEERTICPHCDAILWKHEKTWSRLCCHNAKKRLTTWKMPPANSPQFEILNLWADQGSNGKLMRRFSRQLNNALALASQKVDDISHKDKGWAPNLVIQGRLYHCVGPLLAEDDSTPQFSQIYVHDTDHDAEEANIRLGWMPLPEDTSSSTSAKLHALLMDLQRLLRRCNPYVHDYVAACDISRTEIQEHALVINADARPAGEHERRYNRPEGWKEIAVLIGESPGLRDITLRFQGGGVRTIDETHRSFDALHFVLLFPEGDDCWNISLHNDRKISARDYYSFHLHERQQQRNSLFQASRLFQEYCCMAFAKIESQRLRYLATHQREIRSELYQNLSDAIISQDHTGHIGRRVILPASFTGGPRDMDRRYQDAMAIVRVFGKPDLFITMTCNPDWPDIKKALLLGQEPKDRPDVVARVFKGYVKQLMKEIVEENIFGNVVAILYVVEFQKRGLPHAHILVILAPENKMRTPEVIDATVCAELPEDGLLCSIVTKCMIHNDCGPGHPFAHCLKEVKATKKGDAKKRCSKHFPKRFVEETVWKENETHPTYRRRAPGAGGNTVPIGDRIVDNSWVVPYNPYLSLRFQCHINVEVCSSVKACKYLFKYVYKGHDRAMILIRKRNAKARRQEEERNEIEDYQDVRSIGASEACWRIYEFDMSERSPAVVTLPIHLENEQNVFFHDGEENEVLDRERPTMLMAWFDYNRRHPAVDGEDQHLYTDFPRYFTWNNKTCTWNRRKNIMRFQTIGRINNVPPSVGDLFYLRILLHNSHAKGKRTFKELRVVNGREWSTYQEACQDLGLLVDDGECEVALHDATTTKMSAQIRQLFVILLEFCNPVNPARLFETHFEGMGDDFKRKVDSELEAVDDPRDLIRAMVLIDIEARLQLSGKQLCTFNLPRPTEEMRKRVTRFNNRSTEGQVPQELAQELDYDQEELARTATQRRATLLPSQIRLVTDVLDAVESKTGLAIFVDAPGGTGKTYCFNTLLAAVRARGEIALAIASSGIAATMLDGGQTFHSRFKAPLTPTPIMTFSISAQTATAEVIRRATLIIWDEAPMVNRLYLEALHRTLCDLMENDVLFGGKVIVLGGDFRQVLPVVKRGSRAQIVDACMNRSLLWQQLKVYRLEENMRLRLGGVSVEAEEYGSWLLQLGDGLLLEDDGQIDLLPTLCLQAKTDDKLSELIRWTYPELTDNYTNLSWMKGRAILAPHNATVNEINKRVLHLIPGEDFECVSADAVVDDNAMAIPMEYLNSLEIPGIPAHRLHLRPGIPLLLLRNLSPKEGLCNGTRLMLRRLVNRHLLEVEVISTNQIAFIPRISLEPKDDSFPFTWKRRQFPVSLAFAITINKSQAQTLSHVGVYLSSPVFTHGQLYVAASRATHPKNIRFCIDSSSSPSNKTRNVVFKEALC